MGGHCIPIDPFYLTWKAREYGISTKFIELAGEVNSSMPDYVMDKVIEALNRQGKPLKAARVLVLGIAYKKNVDDMWESPSVVLLEKLRTKGAEIAYADPHVPVFPKMRDHYFELSSVPLSPSNVRCFDCVVVATHHDGFDWSMIRQHAQIIVDTRGVYRPEGDVIYRA